MNLLIPFLHLRVEKLKFKLLYDKNVLRKIFKSNFYKLLIIFIIYALFIELYLYLSPLEMSPISLEFALGIWFNFNFLNMLWMIFQLFFTIYFSYIYCYYEINNSPEFIFLRTSFFKFALKKYFVLESLVFLFRNILYTFFFFSFYKSVTFNPFSLFLNILIHFCVSSIIFLSLLSFKFIKRLG